MGTNSEENPHFGGHLLIIVSEPYTDDHTERILEKVSKGLLSWDVTKTGSDLTGLKDEFIKEFNPEQQKDFIVQYSTERLAVEVLLNPKISVLKQCLNNLLSSSTAYKHVIYAGYAFTGSGSWILRDGAFSFKAFSEIFNNPDVQCVLMKIPECSVHVHCTAEGDWCESSITENMSCVLLNPPDITSSFPGCPELLQYLKKFLVSRSVEEMMKPSAVVGNIRFTRPTLYVFPGGDGNCALFGISGFNMLVDGGFERKPCFWEFVRHIDRLDAMIITRVNENNLNGITSLIKRKQKEHVFPHIGYIFCNITDGKDSPCDEVPKDKDDLLVSILDEGHEFLNNLNNLNLKPHLCFRENGTDPLTLYHKMGHGTLDMYVLNPPKEKKEVKEFFQQWSSKKDNFLSTKNGLKPCDDTSIPLSDLVSISALVVWRPANLKDPITRILITGNAPQSKIFEGLETIKDLEILQQFDCTQSVFRKTVGDKPKLIKNAEKPVAKVLPKPNTSSPSGPQKKTVQKIHVTTAKKDNAIINKTTSERRPSDPIKNLKKNIDSKKLETKVDGKSLESSKDISKTVTPTRKGKELQSSDAKKTDSTLKTATSVERKTKGAKDINNKKTVETKIANKNVRAEIKSKRPETPTKISNVSNETSKKTPTSSPKHSTKLSSSKSVRKPQQMENVKKQEHKLASTKVEEHPKMEEKSSFGLIELKGSLDTEVEFKAKSSVITDVQKMDEDGSLISMVTKTETDTINSLEKALFQPSSDDTGDFDNANLVGYDQSTVKEAVVTETEYLGQINEKVLPQTEQLSEYVLTDKAKDITETGGIQSEKDEVKLDNEVISCNKRELDVSLNKTEGLPQNETFSGNTQDCFQTKHGTNDTSEVLTRMENVPKGEDHDLRVTSTPSVSSDQKCPQTDSDEDQGLNKVNGMTEINLCEKEKGEAEIEFQLRTTTEELDYAERVYGDEEATQFGSIVPDAGVGWSKMDSGIADKDLHSIDNYVSDSKGQGFYEVEKDLFEEDSQRVTIREETEDNFTDKSSKSAPGTDIQYFNGGVADDRSTIVDSSVGDEQIVKSEYQMDKDIEKPVCQNTVENIHDFDVGMSERGQTVQELQSPESSPREPVYLKDQDNYKENISENQTLDKTQLFQQSKDDSENLDCEDKLFASTITSEQSFDEFNVKTNTEEKETTEVKLTEESGSSGSALSISDVKFHHNKGNNMGIPSENEIPETEGLLATHLEESENHSFTTEEMSDIQTGTVLQEHTKIPIFDKIQEKELENQLNQTELAHQNEDDFCFSVKEAIGNVLDPTEQELLKGNACEQMFAIDSAGYSNVHGYSLASEEQKSTLPLDSFNLNYRESNPENLANQCYNQKGSDDFYLNKYDSELSDYKNDQVDFDHRNTINEIKESLYLHPLEKEETGKNSKEQQMISHENNLDQQKTAELLKDHIHVLGSQLGIKSEPHTSDKDYSASETLDAVSDDILPEDGTPCGEVEKSFDQSFSEGFPNSSHEKNLEIKEAIHAVPHEKEITQFMNPDEMYFAHDNAIKHEQEITEDDGEMIRYPTPPGEQDFYEHVGPDAHLKEDHIESGSYILQYDVTGQHSQACEDLTEQPLYEESEEDESERSASPVVEEPVYGSTLTANYPEVVSISEGTTPSEPQSPLDAKQRVQDKTRDHSTEHHNTQEKTEYLENANETNLEQEKSQPVSGFPHLTEHLTEGSLEDLERDFCSQKHSTDIPFECKTKDVFWDKNEQEFPVDKTDPHKEEFLYEESSDLAPLSSSHQNYEDHFGVSNADIKNDESAFAYQELTCSDKDSFPHHSSSELFGAAPTDLARENLQATSFEDTRNYEQTDSKTSETGISYDITADEKMELQSSNLTEHDHLKNIDNYGSDGFPAYQGFSTAVSIRDEGLNLPLGIKDKEPNSFITRDSSSSSSEDDGNPYYEEQASHYSYSNRTYYQEDDGEMLDYSTDPAYSKFPHQSQFNSMQNPMFDDFQSQKYEKLQEDSAMTIHTKSSEFNRSDEEFHLDNWDKPLGLPTPPDSQDFKRNKTASKTAIKGSTRTPVAPTKSNLNVKKGLLNGKSTPTSERAASPRNEKTNLTGKPKVVTTNGLVDPIYVDLTYVPNHGDPNYCDVEFFRKIRARYYVFSGTNPTKEAFSALLEAKQGWNDKDAEVTIIPTHETDAMGYWIALNQEALAANKIEVAPSADRCTINLQDHETSCAAYRLEF